MRKNFAIIDTETLGGAKDKHVNTYDFSAVAYDRQGNWKDSLNILILEHLVLDTAYYGKFKKEFYKELLRKPSTTICYTEDEALEVIENWFDDNDITTICAHNSAFDFEKTFFSAIAHDYEIIDTWLAFAQTIGQTKRYNNFCVENDYVTKTGNIQMTAEICYRYISGDNEFVEQHTAFADASIEAEILFAVFATHKKFARNCHMGTPAGYPRMAIKAGAK